MTVIVRSGADDVDVVNVLYQNVFATGALSWTSQQAGFEATNSVDDDTWNSWKPTAVTAYMTVDNGAAVYCDTLGIAAHNMGSSGSGFTVQCSANGTTWTTISATYSPATNDDILVYFPRTSARYWRIGVSGAVCAIGVVKLGSSLKFPCAALSGHKALHHSRKVEMLSNESMGGNFLGNRPIKMGAQTNINVGSVLRDWAENDLAEFEIHYNLGGAFFYCGAPSDTPKDMGYCRREGDLSEMSVTWIEGDALADVSFDVKSYVAI